MTAQARMFARSPRSVRRAREFVASLVGTADRADDIRVCVSELASNALRHTPVGRLFLVRLDMQEHLVRIEVHDAGDGRPRVCSPADTDDRGRGLLLVAALADDWGTTDRHGPGKAVWVAFKLPGTTLPAAGRLPTTRTPKSARRTLWDPAGVPRSDPLGRCDDHDEDVRAPADGRARR